MLGRLFVIFFFSAPASLLRFRQRYLFRRGREQRRKRPPRTPLCRATLAFSRCLWKWAASRFEQCFCAILPCRR